jgi:hypothetical protein
MTFSKWKQLCEKYNYIPIILDEVMWIVSGISCVGKTFFLENKKDRLLEITNSYHTSFSVRAAYSVFGRDIANKNFNASDWEHLKNICVHLQLGNDSRMVMGAPYYTIWERINKLKIQKKVIVLGVPRSEHKVRVKCRDKIKKVGRPLLDDVQILNLYRKWIDELNEKEIPYLLVEAIGDYKVLEEEDFFRMLK